MVGELLIFLNCRFGKIFEWWVSWDFRMVSWLESVDLLVGL